MGVGCHRLGLANKPTHAAKKQALAAAGQVHLMKYYEDFMNAVGLVSMATQRHPHATQHQACMVSSHGRPSNMDHCHAACPHASNLCTIAHS